MSHIATIDVTCSSCGAADAEPIATVQDFELRTCDNDFVFVRCLQCGLTYLKNRPAIETLRIIYPTSYYDYHRSLGPVVARIRDFVQKRKVRALARRIPDGALVVDVGCGTGELLKAMKRSGSPTWRLVGLDIAPESIASLKRDGIEGQLGRFEDLMWTLPPPDVIVMNQVIEHLENPSGSVRRAFAILKPSGRLIIETPSVDAWDAALFRDRYWGGWHCPRHWNLYTPATLTSLLERCGFVVEGLQFLANPYAWSHSLQNLLEQRFNAPRLAAICSERNPAFLASAVSLDLLQKLVSGRTSNMRVTAVKHPGHR
jgi:SAM-dependent methyltransferase